jgi:hypothetical protein
MFAEHPQEAKPMIRTLANDDVVFVCPSADPSAYAKYGATVIASGSTHDSDYVNKLKRHGLHTTGTVQCLTAGSHDLHAHADLAQACARDIEGNPIAVPWLGTNSFQDAHGAHSAPSFFGCTNHPAFRAHVRRKVCDAIAGGASGLHIDEHLGSAMTALHLGGCFCDCCVSGFMHYLKVNGSADLCSEAKVHSFEDFDYRSFVKSIAPSRDQYLSLDAGIPLHREFIDFHLMSAADNVVSLGKLAMDVAGKPVSLSANARLPMLEHLVVVPHLTYCASEIAHNAHEGTKGLAHAVTAYRMAETLRIPMASTATHQDWAYINKHGAEQLVCTWIALAYACGQRFMVPNRVLCSVKGDGTHWYCGSADTFAPLFQFIKKHGFLLNDFAAVGPLAVPERIPSSFETHEKRQTLSDALSAHPSSPISAGTDAWVFPRVKSDGSVAIHVVNLSCGEKSNRCAAQTNLEVRIPGSLFKRNYSDAIAHGYGSEPVKIPVASEGQTCSFVLPELKLWSIVTFEYWA